MASARVRGARSAASTLAPRSSPRRKRGYSLQAAATRWRRGREAGVVYQSAGGWPACGQGRVAVCGGGGWHPSVIGIVAGRLKEKLHRPAIVIALDEDGGGKGSGRSISGVDLGAAILAAKETGLLVAGGGHAMAAGLTVAADKVDALGAFLNDRLAAAVERASGPKQLLIAPVLAHKGVNPLWSEAAASAGLGRASWRERGWQ